jgi:hypothetical protein
MLILTISLVIGPLLYYNRNAMNKLNESHMRDLEQENIANENLHGIDVITNLRSPKKNRRIPIMIEPINPNSTVDYFANNGYAKTFDTMQYPMGLYDDATDTTFLVYQGPHEDPYIVSYHHSTSMWKGPFRIGVSELGHDEGDPVQMHDGRMFAHGEVAIDPETNRMKKTRKFQADNHGKPSIVIADDGYIHISYGAHGGDIGNRKKLGINHYGDYSGGRQFHYRSKRPLDISSGFEIRNQFKSVYNGGRGRNSTMIKHSRLSWNGCYAQFVQIRIHKTIEETEVDTTAKTNTASSAIYHFVRHGAHVSCWTYQVSINNGRTFGPVIPLVKTGQQKDQNVKDSWYCRFRGGADSSRSQTNEYNHYILAVCVYHNHWMPPHTHTLEAHNVYFMYLDTRSGTWYNVQGDALMSFPEPHEDHFDITVDSLYYAEDPTKRLKLVGDETELYHQMGLTKEMADAQAMVIDTENNDRFGFKYLHPGSVAIDEQGRPHLLLKIAVDGEKDGLKIGRGRKRMFYVKWTGTQWTEPVAITDRYYDRNPEQQVEMDEDGDIILHDATTISVIFPLNNSTCAEVSMWNSVDGGVTWDKEKSLYSVEGIGKLKISALIRRGRSDAQVVAYNLDGTRRNDPYRKLYLIGKNGAVPRKQIESDICHAQKVSDTAVQCLRTMYNNSMISS